MENIQMSILDYDGLQDDYDNYFINKIDIMPDLPISFQIDLNSYTKTSSNLYKYFQNIENVKDLPSPFYELYIDNFAERAYYRTRFKPCIIELMERFMK